MKPTDILEQEKKCIQEEPAYCSAVCPVHLDVRGIMAYLQKGSFDQAAQIFYTKTLFPGIISRTCSAPCEMACLRRKIDEGVSIRMLERACADFGETTKRKYSRVPKKEKVAVIGGGLTGLSCTLELVRKGYKVTVFEKEARLGGSLWNIDSTVLPPDILQLELDRVTDEDIVVELDTLVEDVSSIDFDAIFVATGKRGDSFGMRFENGKAVYDPVSLASSIEGIFAGGSLVMHEDSNTVIHKVAHGSTAARSIERYLKKASLTSGRENEGIQDTRLYTDIRHHAKTPGIVPKAALFTREEAINEAKRCMLCECMECVKACSFLEYFHSNPKQYIRDITKTVTAQQGIRSKMVAARIINSCSLCGQCAEICPNGLDMGGICQESRFLQVQADTMPPAFYDFWLRDFNFAINPDSELIKNQNGFNKSAYLFFPGCRMGSSNPDYVVKSYQYLTDTLSGGVGLAVTCCGALAEWSGHKKQMEEHADRFIAEWERLGKPVVITACTSCQKIFAKYLKDVRIKSLWEVFEEKPLPCNRYEGKTVALYDPCSSRYEPKVQNSIRKLLLKTGYTIEELQYNGRLAQCCSYGGLISTVNPELSEKIKQMRVNLNPNTYVTYCVNCRDYFSASGKPIWYMLDILFDNGDEHTAKRKPPTVSKRRENQKLLKQTLLEVFWNEKMEQKLRLHEAIQLKISEELHKKMNDELIYEDEVKQVVYHTENTGNKLIDNMTKHFIAHLQIGIITYWVEYLPEGSGYIIFNVYSHRLQIVQEGSNERF